MRKRIIAGNWKMYKTAEEAKSFVKDVQGEIPVSDYLEAVICPPTLYLSELVQLTKESPLGIGAQTMHDATEGAYTGEVSPAMLSSIGVGYVVLGHSERRQYFNETDESVNRKVHAAFEYKLTPIVCVGESLEDRESGKTVELVANQVTESIRRHQHRLGEISGHRLRTDLGHRNGENGNGRRCERSMRCYPLDNR